MRSVIARFRISAHSLHVESSRHDKKLYKERICQFCPNNESEDEIHLLLKCKFYPEFRVSLLEELKLYFSDPLTKHSCNAIYHNHEIKRN